MELDAVAGCDTGAAEDCEVSQSDAFDYIRDDLETRTREKVINGVVVATVKANAIASPLCQLLGMAEPFGTYAGINQENSRG